MGIMPTPKPNKHGVYEVRFDVPKELQPIIGKKVLRRSLGTKNANEAKIAYLAVSAAVQETLKAARDELKCRERERENPITQENVEYIASVWAAHMKTQPEELESRYTFVWRSGQIDDPVNDAVSGCVDVIKGDGFSLSRIAKAKDELAVLMKAEIDEALAFTPLPLTELWLKELALQLAIKRLYLTGYIIEIIRANGRLKTIEEWAKRQGLSSRPILPATKVASAESISMIFKLYQEVMLRREPDQADKRILDYTPAINRFIECYGDLDIGDITKKHVMQYRSMLEGLPRYPKQEIAKLPIHERIEKAKELSLKTLSFVTVKNLVKGLSAVLQFAVGEGIIEQNPAHSLPTRKTPLKPRTHKGYHRHEIDRIFGHDLFQHRLPLFRGEAAYWIPMIAYYSGARVEEIAQLRRRDIKEQDGITFFSITNGGEGEERLSVKNGGSIRSVPVHSHLIELGFIEYVELQADRIFPLLTRGTKRKLSHKLSSWWGDFVREILIERGSEISRPMHYFRDTVQTLFRSAKIHPDVMDRIGGWHTAERSERASYGEAEMIGMRDAIETIPRIPVCRVTQSIGSVEPSELLPSVDVPAVGD